MNTPDIPGYRIGGPLGSGTTGTVYAATQTGGVHLEVAIKVIHPDLLYTEWDSRFQVEKATLARLDHSGIARILEAGTSEEGLSYLVMERIDGLPIDEFCDLHRLTVDARIELLARVADIVAVAHRNGVLHRDIKPANILVAGSPEDPVPKVIDFGLAKLHEPGPDALVNTRAGSQLGSPMYMPPEQFAFDVAVDSRADVYALGAVLYELVTGQHLVDLEQLEQLDAIQQREALMRSPHAKPSERAHGCADAPRVAELRRTTPQRLAARLRGDLDIICTTSIARARELRYASADLLAQDIRRHLRQEPISARSPSLPYVIQKAAERHRTLAVAVTVAGVLLAASWIGLAETTRRARTAETEAAAEARDARALSDFLLSHFSGEDMILAEGPTHDEIDRAHVRLEQRLAGMTAAAGADALLRLSRAYQGLAQFDKADALLAEAVQRLQQSGLADSALAPRFMLERAFLAGRHENVALADSLANEVLAVESVRAGSHLTHQAYQALGLSASRRGDYASADSLLHHALAITEDEPALVVDRRIILADLGQVLNKRRNFHEGEARLREALQLIDTEKGPDPRDRAKILHHLGISLSESERYDEAIPVLEEVVSIQRQWRSGPALATTLNDLANAYWFEADTTKSLILYLESLDLKRRLSGERHPSTFSTLCSVADIYAGLGDYRAAIRTYREAESIYSDHYGTDHPNLAVSSFGLGIVYQKQGALAEALRCFRNAARLDSLAYGTEEPYYLDDVRMVEEVMRAMEEAEATRELSP